MNPAFYCPRHHPRTHGDRCIVSCGTQAHYYESLHSTRLHCSAHIPEAWQLFYYGYPDGCPAQQEKQYAFKIYALRRAWDASFGTITWIDSAFQPIASVEPLWAEVERAGWWIPAQGDANLGNWTSDRALEIFGITRDVAMDIPLCYSGLVSILCRTSIGKEIWRLWQELYDKGAFNGPHQNIIGGHTGAWGNKTTGECSKDPRCHGHRHDESALSFVLYKLGLKPSKLPFLTLESEQGFIGHHVELVVPSKFQGAI